MKKTQATSVWGVSEILYNKYGKDYQESNINIMYARLNGKYKSKKIRITFYGEYCLLISIEESGRRLLQELVPTITEIMGNEGPICSYDLQLGPDKEIEPTMEWDIKDPDKRIRKIVNRIDIPKHVKISNLKILTGKDVSEYLDSNQNTTQTTTENYQYVKQEKK